MGFSRLVFFFFVFYWEHWLIWLKAIASIHCCVQLQYVPNVEEEWAIARGWQRGDRDPGSCTNFNKIHASCFESVIVGETSGKQNFHNQTQIIHESRIPHEINHLHMHSGIHESRFFLSNFHASRSSFSPYHASRINPLPPSC